MSKPYNEMSTAERLEIDIERVALFRMEASTGITDEVWENQIKPDLISFALAPSAGHTTPRLVGMILKGRVFERRIELGAPRAKDLCLPIQELAFEEAHELAHDVVERMLPYCRRGLMIDRWDGMIDGAAPLGSWFINLCCFGFAASWRPFIKRRQAAAELMAPGPLDPEIDIGDPREAPEDAVIIDLHFEHFLEYVDERDQAIIRLDSLGQFTDQEIGDLIGLKRRQVERRKGKAREKARRRRDFEHELENLGRFTPVVA